MICHQGSARASPRLRQALPAAKGLSPRTQGHAFHPDTHPQKAHMEPQLTHPTGSVPPSSSGAAPPEGTATSPPPRSDQPSVGYWENTEHSASTPPGAPRLARRPRTRWEQRAQMSRAARQAPAAAARSSCPVSKAIPELRVQGVPGCLQARQQPPQNPSGMVYLEGYFKPLLK